MLHDRLFSRRPPPGAPHYNASAPLVGVAEIDQRRCAKDELCRRFYRGNSSLYLPPGSLCAAIRRRFPVPNASTNCNSTLHGEADRVFVSP